jgi:hypothetical protein
MSSRTITLSIDELRIGVICSHPVESESGVLLLSANTRITQQLIEGLRDRGIMSIEVDPRDLAALRGTAGGKPKKVTSVRERAAPGHWPKNQPVKSMLVDRHQEPLSAERGKQLGVALAQAKQRMDHLRQQLAANAIRSVSELADVSDSYGRAIVDDHDQTLGVVGGCGPPIGLDERSVRLATLGMAVGIELGLDGSQMMEIGMTGLLHDIGLHAMDEKFRNPYQLSAAERWEYQKHPHLSLTCIQDAIDVSESVQIAIEQVHEQFDGSGFPRGLKSQRIHQSARILNVVDAYLQLTMTSAQRSVIVPHDALGLILHLAGRGLFDPQVVRAFLNIETLFPLGSAVELSTGQQARVIRRPRQGFSAPVLVDETGMRIEMEESNLQIVRPVCDEQVGQTRLLPEQMLQSHWHPAGPEPVV